MSTCAAGSRAGEVGMPKEPRWCHLNFQMPEEIQMVLLWNGIFFLSSHSCVKWECLHCIIIYWKYITCPLVIGVHRVPWFSEETLDFGTESGLLKTRKKPVMNQGWRSLVLVRFPAASEASNSGSGTRSHSSLGPQVLWKSYFLQQLQSRCRPRVGAYLELGPLEPGKFQNSQQKLKTQTGGTSRQDNTWSK